MYYSGNPLNPTEYNPVQNTKTPNDPNVLQRIELSETLGQSVPAGDRQINSLIAPIISGDRLNITGDSYLYGPVQTTIIAAGGALFPDGSPGAPSIGFITDPDTGIYHNTDGTTSFTSNGSTVVEIGPELNVGVPITTPGGQNLVINPSGPSVDFTGHSLINVASITTDPNHYELVGAQVITTNAVPTLGLSIGTDPNAAYVIIADVACADFTDNISSAGFIARTKGKNIAGVASVVSPYMNITLNTDVPLTGCTVNFTAAGPNILVNVQGIAATNIKWRVAARITRQLF